jgi:large subunit ribosomal protein L4
MKFTVFSSDAKTSSEKDFAGLPTFEGDKGLQAVKEVIVAINANNRQGTHSTKTRGEVRGGGKKPWRQTGKVKALAFSRALFDRASAGEIAVIESFVAPAAKTKGMNAVVSLIAPKGKVLLVDAPFAVDTARASRNLERVTLQEAAKLNTLDLAQYAKIIVSTKALEAIIARVNGGKN